MKVSAWTSRKNQTQAQGKERIQRAARFLVYYDGGFASVAALRYACASAIPGTEITAVYLMVVPQSESLDAQVPGRTSEGKAVLAGAIANAHKYGSKIKTEILPCRVKGPALVNLADERGAAHIFLGVEQSANPGITDAFVEYVAALAPSGVTLVES